MFARFNSDAVDQSCRQTVVVIFASGLHMSMRDVDAKCNRAGQRFVLPARFAGIELASTWIKRYADKPVTEPIIEAVMIDTKSQQGISFARRGSVISDVVPNSPRSDTNE